MTGAHGSVPRRTIVQGAAWTIPVVAVAAGAPFASASPQPAEYHLSISRFDVAPNAAQENGSLGWGASLTYSQRFNTVLDVYNSGPDDAPAGTTVQMTFPAESVAGPDHFKTASSGWTITGVTLNSLNRWVVTAVYSGVIAPQNSATPLVINSSTKIQGAMEVGSWRAVGRISETGGGTASTDDVFYTNT